MLMHSESGLASLPKYIMRRKIKILYLHQYMQAGVAERQTQYILYQEHDSGIIQKPKFPIPNR